MKNLEKEKQELYHLFRIWGFESLRYFYFL